MQKWSVIDGLSGLYEINNLGEVRKISTGRIIKTFPNAKGYIKLRCRIDMKVYYRYIHRCVALAFIPNPLNLPQVDHINRIRSDNNIKNLRWATNKDNCNNSILIGKCSHVKKRRK